jgi:hypothetical protein
MSIEVKKTRFAGVGWEFEELHPGSAWKIVARRGERILVARSQDRDKAWEGVIEAIERGIDDSHHNHGNHNGKSLG